MTTEPTEPTTPDSAGAAGGDDSGDLVVGFAPSQNARAAALAELAELGKADGEADPTDPPGEPTDAEGEGAALDEEGKPRRREVDAKKLEEEEKARKAKEAEQPTSAAFKKLRRERRDLEQLQANVAAGRRQVEQMQAQLRERLDKADALEALEAELRASPAKVLRRYGADLSAVNVDWMRENDPQSQVKTLAEQLDALRKEREAEKAERERAAQAQTFEAEVSSCVGKMTNYVKDTADEDPKACPAANFFREVDPKDFGAILREAVLYNAKQNGGTVVGDEVVRMVDEHYKERYLAIQARYQAGSARTSNGTVTPAKLDSAPQALSRAASAPVGSKDPESYEERWKAAMSELR